MMTKTVITHVTITGTGPDGKEVTWTGAVTTIHEKRVGPNMIPAIDLRVLYPTKTGD